MVPYAKMPSLDAPNASNAVGVAVPYGLYDRSAPRHQWRGADRGSAEVVGTENAAAIVC